MTIAREAIPSTAPLLQQVVDGEVLFDQPHAAPEGVGRLLRCEPLKAAVPHAVVLTEITVNRLEAVVRLAATTCGSFPSAYRFQQMIRL